MKLAWSSFYYKPRAKSPDLMKVEADLRDRIEAICLEQPDRAYSARFRKMVEGFDESGQPDVLLLSALLGLWERMPAEMQSHESQLHVVPFLHMEADEGLTVPYPFDPWQFFFKEFGKLFSGTELHQGKNVKPPSSG